MTVIIVILTGEEFERLRGGDRELYVRMYNEYKKPVYNIILARVAGDREAAQDILQETFLSALGGLSRLKNPEHIDGWIITIAKNKVIDYFRKTGRAEKYTRIASASEPETECADVSEKIMDNERIALLQLGMKKLNPLHRDILRMKCWDDMSIKEIAEKLERTPKAAENILFRAKESLKRELEKLSGGEL